MNSQQLTSISVVIPAFKLRYLSNALDSLVQQSDPRFEVIVADDGSPEDLSTVVNAYQERLKLTYVRFDQNIGGQDLVAHWNRAIALASSQWILLLGDDDELEPRCIESAVRAIESAPDWRGLWRLDVVRIDSEGRSTEQVNFPVRLSALEFLRGRFECKLLSTACEYVFHRDKLQALGGFVSFPVGWGSDSATWFRLANPEGIRTIVAPAARARFRLSGINLSTQNSTAAVSRKIDANLKFLAWTLSEVKKVGVQRHEFSEKVGDPLVWFSNCLTAYHQHFRPAEILSISLRYLSVIGDFRPATLLRALKFVYWSSLPKPS